MKALSISLCSTGFKSVSFNDVIQTAGDLNLDGVEWWSGHLKSCNIQEVKTLMKKHHLLTPAVSEYANFSAGTSACEQDVLRLKSAIELAAFLEAPMVRVFAGHVSSSEASSTEWELAVQALKEVCIAGLAKNVLIAVETHNNTFADCDPAIQKLLKEVNHQSLCLIYDPFNFLVAKENPFAVLDSCYSKIKHVHMKNFFWNHSDWNKSEETVLFSGDLDQKAVFSRLLEKKYCGFYSMEYFGENKVRLIHESALLVQQYKEKNL
ncbi:sugar phosphate isomerase/epimerase family protein [Metabacillus sp. RGM 3146]|uniref:sugar phosphate isomerase/epimerase family protein n=1 Tax=Metabacillus sp. RGM 3146 TaxID=3401092 RepID=UPI003B9AC781